MTWFDCVKSLTGICSNNNKGYTKFTFKPTYRANIGLNATGLEYINLYQTENNHSTSSADLCPSPKLSILFLYSSSNSFISFDIFLSHSS